MEKKLLTNKVIEYAFKVLNAPYIFVGHNPYNVASKNLIKALGFQYIEDVFYRPTGLNHPSYILKNNR